MANSQGKNSDVKTLVVVGAGPKAAAISAKARVLAKLGYAEIVKVVVVEQGVVANNWCGKGGFTHGKCVLGTPPEKDVGFPYNSAYGSEVDIAMLAYSWQAFKFSFKNTGYGEWVDRGREHPLHDEWARYINWVLRPSRSESERPEFVIGQVVQVIPAGGKLQIKTNNGKRQLIEADGIVFTGPGPAKMLPLPSNTQDIYDGQNYWLNIPMFRNMTKGNIALIGGGETAASIALSLLDLMAENKGPVFNIEIINRNGIIFTRGESYRENRIFTNPQDWKRLDEASRIEIIKRTDRGVFSVAAQTRLNQAERVNVISGDVTAIERARNKIAVRMKRGEPPKDIPRYYDKVIVARGFDPFNALQLLPPDVRPACGTPDEKRDLERKVDNNLRISFDSAPQPPAEKVNVHMPMIAGFAQGPGYPNLSCLGYLSDAILLKYIKKKPQAP
jgi:mycobactin lysine-N-oxygenase